MELLARTGEAAPEVDGGVFSYLAPEPGISPEGRVVLRGSLALGELVTPENHAGIWTNRAGALSLLARTGDAAPGTGEGVVFLALTHHPVINAQRTIALAGSLAGAGIDATNNTGLWMHRSARRHASSHARGTQSRGSLREWPSPPSPSRCSTTRTTSPSSRSCAGRASRTSTARRSSSRGTPAPWRSSRGPATPSRSPPATPAPCGRSTSGFTRPRRGAGSSTTPGTILFRASFVGGSTAILAGDAHCAADIDNDGVVGSQDFFDFLTLFFASDPGADFNGSGDVTSQDFFDFLTAFFAGC